MQMPANEASAGSRSDALDSFDDVECQVTFELGHLTMSVDELSRLRPGRSLTLGVRLEEQPVRIVVNGRRIGSGELALLGDELVVIVAELPRLPEA